MSLGASGLQVNDLILSVQGDPVPDITSFREILTGHDLHEGIRLVVRTGAMKRFVFVRLEE